MISHFTTQTKIQSSALNWELKENKFQDGFRDSFGLLLPSLADHFGVGRAEAILTCSIMTLLTLGRYHIILCKFWCESTWSLPSHIAVGLWRLLGVFFASAGISVLHLVLNRDWFSITFSGLLIAGLYIESGPTVQNILVVHVCVGGLVGLGFGLMYLPAMDIVPHFFDRRCTQGHYQAYIKTCTTNTLLINNVQ